MNEKYKLLSLLIEGYYIETNMRKRHLINLEKIDNFEEEAKNQIEDSTGLNIEDVLKLHKINKKVNWEKIVDRKDEERAAYVYGALKTIQKGYCKLTLRGRFIRFLNNRTKQKMVINCIDNITPSLTEGKSIDS